MCDMNSYHREKHDDSADKERERRREDGKTNVYIIYSLHKNSNEIT